MGPFKAPDGFDFSRPQSWPEWKQRFLRFRQASKMDKEDGAVQVSSLVYTMGSESERILTSFNLTEEEEKNFNTVLKKFDDHFVPKRNIIHERAKFYARSQNVGENIETYLRSLYELSENADFPDKEDAIRDRLVLGVRDVELSEKLQLQPDLKLQGAVQQARQFELVKLQLNEQRQSQQSVDAVGQRSTRGASRGGPRGGQHRQLHPAQGGRHHTTDSHQKSCTNCGGNHDRSKPCPAKGKRCRACGKQNHFERVCRSSRPHQVREVAELSPETTYFLGSVANAEEEPPWRTDLVIQGRRISFKIDTGADVSVIPKRVYDSLRPKPKLRPSFASLRSPGGELRHLGTFNAGVRQDDRSMQLRIFVLNSDCDSLLSRDAALRLGLVKRLDDVKNLAFGEIGEPVQCDPVKICLQDDATPYSVTTPRRIPIPILPKVEAELQRMEKNGVIERVTEATDWCAPMVPVMKKGGGVRICVDLKKLNRAIKRQRYMLPTIEDITHKLQGSKIFTKLDATSGFWQLPLDEETARLTTFITPFGRYFFRRLPFGISIAPEVFQRTMESILRDIDGVEEYMDDILVHADCQEKHDKILGLVLERLAKVGLKLNKEKCEFNKEEINFLGHTFNKDGVKPDSTKLEAIQNMEDPKDVSELRRWLGMVNYLGRFVPDLSETLHPLNDLLHKDSQWLWGQPQITAMKKVKALLSEAPTLAYYDAKKRTVISADASSYGLGGVLLQEHNGELKPVAFCSRTLTSAEKGYAQIEKECLAMVWACEKFDRYLVGLDSFTALTDHRPLISLVNKRDLQETPLRCQRLLMRLMRYNVTAEYVPGKDMVVADALSRSPMAGNHINRLQNDIEEYVNEVMASWPASDAKLNQIREATQQDVNLKTAMEYTISGWPTHKQDVWLAARDLFNIRQELSVCDGLLLRGDRIVIPYSMRREMLDRIHDGHLGITKSRERANQAVWWPGLSKDVETTVSKCRFCLEKQPSQKHEPLMPSSLPTRPFERMAADLCEFKGQHFLVTTDYFSRYIDIGYLPNISSASVINKLKNTFAHHGIPQTLISDNGRQFSSEEFKNFASEWNFTHVTSSPHFPQSNGAAERAVKIAKDILKQDDVFLALLTYRSTPLPELGASPAELAFGRRLRTTLPTLPKTLLPRTVDPDTVRRRDETAKARQAKYHDSRHGARPLFELQPGDPVLVKKEGEKSWNQPATVHSKCAPRSYIIQTPNGHLRRNRRHLRLQPESPHRSSSGSAAHLPLAVGTPGGGTGAVPVQPPPSPVRPPVTPTDPESSSSAGDKAQAAVPDSGGTYVTRAGRSIQKPARFRED